LQNRIFAATATESSIWHNFASFAGSGCMLQLLCTSPPQLRFSSRATAFGLFGALICSSGALFTDNILSIMALGSSFVEQLCRIQALGQYSWRNASGNIFAEQHWGQDSFGQLSGSFSRQLGE
jgi:hypothetical protein